MTKDIFQIVYCSRNTISGTAADVRAQIETILQAARRNNARVGVTGALFYNSIFFAQVLEGSLVEVQKVFERLQLDPRHADMVVLQTGFAPDRSFANWSMAFAGASTDLALPFQNWPAHSVEVAAGSPNGQEVMEFLRDLVLKQESWALPERPSGIRLIGSAGALAH